MGFRNLDRFLSSLDEIGVNGCAASVWYRGENVFRKFYGTQDAEGKVPTNEKTVYSLFSMSKLFTSCAAMMLIERGKMKLDDPISRWLPAYGRMTWKNGEEILPCQNAITVEDLMSMQAGFDYDVFAPEIKKVTEIYQEKGTTRQYIDALAAKPLCFEPGTRFQYSLCHDVLGAVIEEVSGMKLRDFMRENIWEPLGISDFSFHAHTYDHPENLATIMGYDMQNGKVYPTDGKNLFVFSEEYDCGGAGILGTCDGYAVFADCLSRFGEALNGYRLLKPETVDLWRKNRLTTEQKVIAFPYRADGYGYGLGVRVKIVGEPFSPLGEFGWDGAAGSYVFIDPDRELSAVYMQNILMGSLPHDKIQLRFRDLVYRAVLA